MPETMKPLAYDVRTRWSDWWHGLRDGLRQIPDRPKAPRPEPISSPHRDVIIGEAQQVYHQEYIRHQRQIAPLPGQIAEAGSREAAARETSRLADARVAALERPLTAEEERERRPGDTGLDDAAVRERRRRSRARHLAAAREAAARAKTALGAATADRVRAEALREQSLQVASARVRLAERLYGRRLDAYLRSLLRFHPDKAWVADQLRFGGQAPAWVRRAATVAPPAEVEPVRPPAFRIDLGPGENVFGADSAEPYRLGEPYAAPRHFRLARDGEHLRLRDFGRGNGPYIGGGAVREALLAPGDHFDFGEYRYYVLPGLDALDVSRLGERKVVALGLEASTDKYFRIRDMSFVQPESTLLAILGPSGAGKSSLFSALLGELPLSAGELYFEGLSLAGHGPQIRERLGFVPQGTDLLATLTVDQLLRYAYRLRGPGRRAGTRVGEVCRDLKLDERRHYRVSALSGGQQRRVSIAMELLNKPTLLLLDEPTSGLDPGLDHEVMTFLRDYAETHEATVMIVTHAVEHLGQAHQVLVVVKQGRPVFYGPPERVLPDLERERWAALMKDLDVQADAFALRYGSRQADAEARDAAAQIRARGSEAGPGPRVKRRRPPATFTRQWRVLLSRQVALLATRGVRAGSTGPVRMWAVALMPFLVAAGSAALAAWVTGPDGLGKGASGDAVTAISLLTTLAMLSGQALTYSDIVAEMGTITREHRTGVLVTAVLAAKWQVFAAVAILQALIMALVFTWIRPGPAASLWTTPTLDLFLVLAVLSVSAMSLGLLISVSVRKLEQAVLAVTLTSVAQIALNGSTADLSGGGALAVTAALLPDRWGLAAAASLTGLPGKREALWAHTSGQWFFDLFMCAALAVAYSLIAVAVLSARLTPRRGVGWG
ncbi:ATP-binding cassette domain-containing protein [Nonomuraea endophytica]|uniref:ABC-type multidrug transport system ATPase subunit n=1 Tax=Nonomuraea endophytica TaxID=714136 RepID=A0A7W8AEH0_9ACTN|nr:ATP-binding cassette domain-containing protein [Nonomuraea endophytica]MBB5083313.1 ABC-type multidrug transport system ATPase subunit [Nonomuraea endophytica]